MANISKIETPDGTTYNLKDSISGYTTNTGTVTSVTIKATSPIAVDSTSAITTSGTRTISHANSGATAGSYGDSSAQTPGYGSTFKVPYVTVNATGHVTGISEHTVKIPASDNTDYALSGALSSHKFTSTLTAGGSGSGTSTSDLTLAAGTGITLTDDTSNRKITIACSVTNTDEKLKVAEVTSGTTYSIIMGSGTSANPRQYDSTGLLYTATTGTTSAEGTSSLAIGNATGTGTAGNKTGQLTLYNDKGYAVKLKPASGTTAVTITIPDTAGTIALTSQIPTVPTTATSHTTGISIAAHGTGTVIGVQSSTTSVTGVSGSTTVRGVKTTTTTASKVGSGGSNGSASTWTFEEKTIPNVTAAGSGSFSATVSNHVLSFSHTHTGPTIGNAIKVQSKSGGGNGTAPNWSFTDVTVPIMADADTTVPKAAASATTVPIKNSSASTFVTGTTHTITDNGHTHTLS